jgi:hypothetical protein
VKGGDGIFKHLGKVCYPLLKERKNVLLKNKKLLPEGRRALKRITLCHFISILL